MAIAPYLFTVGVVMKRIVQRLLLFLLGGIFAIGVMPAFPQALPTPRVDPLPSQEHIDQGRTFYQQGRWADAIATWQAVLEHPSFQSDPVRQAAVWTYLGMAYQKLGQWSAAADAIAASRTLLNQLPEAETPNRLHILAQTLNTQAQLDFAQGNPEAAFTTWRQTTQIYRDLGYSTGITGSLINQARALEVSGHYRRACQTLLEAANLDQPSCDFRDLASLEPVAQAFNQQPNPDLQVLGLRSLGNVLRLAGLLAQANHLLEQSVAISRELDAYPLGFSLLSLGLVEEDLYEQATFRYQQTELETDRQAALTLARQALERYAEAGKIAQETTGDRLLIVQANVKRLTLLVQLSANLRNQDASVVEPDEFRDLLRTQLQAVLNLPTQDLPPSRAAIYSQINLAQSFLTLWQASTFSDSPAPEVILQQLTHAHQQAVTLQDRQAQSYALGVLGLLYEQRAHRQPEPVDFLSQARQFTESALGLAQANQAWHIAYQWQWQLGRIHQALAEPQLAIAHYQSAVETLQAVRHDLLAIEAHVQFSFRDTVEPLYRELVALLIDSSEGAIPAQRNLQQALQEIDALRLTELENFLSCNLTQTFELSDAQTDAQTAILYPIILPDQLVVILRLPRSEALQFHRVTLPEAEVSQTLKHLRQQVENRYLSNAFFDLSRQVYDWLIQPFEDTLNEQSVQTLVFVSDGVLRNAPMAALYNGQHFLIEDYAIALSPGLQLPASQPLSQLQLSAIAFGLSEIRSDFPPHQGFASLINIEPELAEIQAQVPSRAVLNQAFTREALQDFVSTLSTPVVHLATHGQFSANPEETFLLAWDQRINIDDLSQILQNREAQNSAAIELLVLSACKTADGDSRATLGLAGVAIQAGARSTIASLWYIDDRSTAELMKHLYRELATPTADLTRAEALRRAQVALLHAPGYRAPIYWAPYVLVGNWL
ncbi:MAG: CHAT domain-containing protein [Leptolyngbyaceae cyanobacterium MO_188.B28]|nr:CHAT domain-containing protein [Leptolyngbyaceae cyanobacterium MO_188.B28]